MCFSSVQFQAKFCVHQSPPTQYCARLLRYPLATTTTTNDYYAHFTGVIFRLYFFFPYDRMIIIIIFFWFSSLSFAAWIRQIIFHQRHFLILLLSVFTGEYLWGKSNFLLGVVFFLSLFMYTRHRHTNSIFIIFLFIFALRKSSLFFVYAFFNHPEVNTVEHAGK